MARRLWSHSRVAAALARRARVARGRRSLLGPLGEGLAPLWPLLVYLPLVAGGALPGPSAIPPVVYAALGYWTWSLLVDSALAPARGLAAHRAPEIAPAAAILAGLADALRCAAWRALVLWPLAVPGGDVTAAGVIAAAGLLLPALALALGGGLILALWAAPWPEVTGGAATVLRLTLLPSLVLFPLPAEALWADLVTMLNPLAVWTDATRALVLGAAAVPHGAPLLIWGSLGVLLLGVAVRGLARLSPALREVRG